MNIKEIINIVSNNERKIYLLLLLLLHTRCIHHLKATPCIPIYNMSYRDTTCGKWVIIHLS